MPRELFDSVADKLLQNVLGKRRAQGDFAISAEFSCGDAARLEVCDAGHAIEAQTALELLRGPVPSASGLGIGLYQVARHAEACGLLLAIEHNNEGRVCFVLSGPLKRATDPAAV